MPVKSDKILSAVFDVCQLKIGVEGIITKIMKKSKFQSDNNSKKHFSDEEIFRDSRKHFFPRSTHEDKTCELHFINPAETSF